MITVTDDHVLPGSLDRVFECFWDVERWPVITPHVKRIEMRSRTPDHQEFSMTVESGGALHAVESVRDAITNRRITYRQTRPPAFLREHTGEWIFEPVAGGTRVTLIHRAVLDLPGAPALLGVASALEAAEKVARALKENGSRTIHAVREFLESNRQASGPNAGQKQ